MSTSIRIRMVNSSHDVELVSYGSAKLTEIAEPEERGDALWRRPWKPQARSIEEGWTVYEAIEKTCSLRRRSRLDVLRELMDESEPRLVSFGRRGPDSPLEPIPDQWAKFKRIDRERSRAWLQNAAEPNWRDIRIYPVVHAPDARSRLAGLLLADAYRRFVLEDPEVQAEERMRAGHHPITANIVERKTSEAFVEYKGPRVFGRRSIAVVPPPPVPAHGTRLAALLGLLQDEKLVAEGTRASACAVAPHQLWSDPQYRPGFAGGELRLWNRERRRFEAEFSHLRLLLPASDLAGEEELKETTSPNPLKNPPGRRPTYNWPQITDKFVDRMGRIGTPETGSALVLEIERIFE